MQELATDYSLFNARDYLDDHYVGDWDSEDTFLIEFLHEAYQSLRPRQTMLEVGGGPTIYQLISARNRVESIVFSDYLKENLQEVKNWKNRSPNAFDWDSYFEEIAKLEGSAGNISIDQMKEELRKKLVSFAHCDVFKEFPLPFRVVKTFDIVSTHFCVDAVSRSELEFLRMHAQYHLTCSK